VNSKKRIPDDFRQSGVALSSGNGKDREVRPVEPRELVALDDAEFGRY